MQGHLLGVGGRVGSVPFVHFNGWTLYLSSANGAHTIPNATVFDVTLDGYYGAEHELDEQVAARLELLSDELVKCANRNAPVVVHCNHGRTRSVIAVGVYLMRVFGITNVEAFEIIKSSFTASEGAHYHAPGERVERALMMYAQLRGNARGQSNFESGEVRRSGRVTAKNVCTGNCG
ncbi:dual specificity protein phosphatase family protein [Rhodanobacter umsongensis]|uniref:Dual specificity protein phosphatase family protein n=1 Tax=Rhodanobacter umsongensis TaxID=633153 RepID=A0ABW0JHN7_9GAMM